MAEADAAESGPSRLRNGVPWIDPGGSVPPPGGTPKTLSGEGFLRLSASGRGRTVRHPSPEWTM